MSLEFKSEDFTEVEEFEKACEYQRHTVKSPAAARKNLGFICAIIANNKLAKWLGTLPGVEFSGYDWELLSGDVPDGKFRGKLVDVEKIN